MAGGVSKRRLQSGKVRWRYYGSFKGEKFYSSAKYLTEADCILARRDHLERLASRGTVKMKLGDCVRQRIQELELQHTMQHAGQTEAYLQKAIDKFGTDISILDIDRNMIQSLLNSEARRLKKAGKGNYRVNGLRTSLHALFQTVIDRYELINFRNPVSKIKRYPIETKVKHIPDQWELDMVENELNAKQRLLFLFCLQSGCRISEAINLTVKDIDYDKRLVTLWSRKSKGSSLVYRKVPLPLIIDEIGRKKLPSSPNVRIFKTWRKTPTFIDLTVQKINNRERKANLAGWNAGWKPITHFNWHNLRHRACSLWLQDDMPIYEVMHRLGHKNLSVTMGYAQLLGYSKFTLIEGQEVDPYDGDF
jgi:integrase